MTMTISETTKPQKKRKNRQELLMETLPQFEQFIENREAYIKALETTIEALQHENQQFNQNNLAIRSSIDELVAMQQLSNSISTAVEHQTILSTLIELTTQVIPVLEANIFLFDATTNKLLALSADGSERLTEEAQQQLEAGIVDWVFSEKKTVIIPNLEYLNTSGTTRNFVMVPILLRNKPLGIYIIHTDKSQQEFSNHDIQLLTVLANQAAAGVENWRAYDQLRKANQDLKTSHSQMLQAAKLAAIGELAAGILHEIKNPVQVLMMYVDMVQRGRTLPNLFDLLSAQVKRLAEITRRLTNFSRNVSEDLPMESVDLNKALLEMIDIVRHQFRNDKIEIALNVAESLPTIHGNANVLQQVFLNLLINARDAMPQGGQCAIVTETKDFNVIVRFSDTGTGIEQELITKIFDPFFTTKGEGKGTGLGLSICKNIISQHRGKITVESAAGKGTTFSITIPTRRPLS
jgi:two-component system, NtrC family, sensor histidine kinase HydH